MCWDGGKLLKTVIKSTLGNLCKVRYSDRIVEFQTESGKVYKLSGDLRLHLC